MRHVGIGWLYTDGKNGMSLKNWINEHVDPEDLPPGSDAYAEGIKAAWEWWNSFAPMNAKRGESLPHPENPYLKGTNEYEMWYKGFRDADKDAQYYYEES